MIRWNWRDLTGVFLAPLIAAVVGATLVHFLTEPGNPQSLPMLEWSFAPTFAKLFPTLLGMSFVYRMAILPYIDSRTRRSAVILTIFAGPALAVGVFAAGVAVASLVLQASPACLLEEFASFGQKCLAACIGAFYAPFFGKNTPSWPSWRSMEWIVVPGILGAIFIAFVLAAALLSAGKGRAAHHPTHPPTGRRALLGVFVIAALSMPACLLMLKRWKIGADRAGCIMNIRNAQQAMRSFQGMNGHNCGALPSFSKWSLIGPDNFIETEPVCPTGGTYTWVEGRIPKIGELTLRCSCPGHVPTNHSDW